jgi:hypothetical protein
MKRAWVEFTPLASTGHVGVHRWWSGEIGRHFWRRLPPEEWDPPVRPVPGKGYPDIYVEVDSFVFEFISTLEILESATVLERNLVDPRTSRRRWYRKLPASIKERNARSRVAALLRKVASAYDQQLPTLARLPSPIPPARGRGTDWRAEIRLR